MPELTANGCAVRRQRLIDALRDARLELAVITDVRDCYYFTGALLPGDLPAALFITAEGATCLACPPEFQPQGLDRIVSYEWNYRGTRHPDPLERFLTALDGEFRPPRAVRVGVQGQSQLWRLSQVLERAGAREFMSVDGILSNMQRRKDPDELEIMRASIQANIGAYTAVAEAIAPGVNELDVLSAGRRGATLAAKEKVFHDGDYQCGAYNGPARNREIQRGELYIVDAWTCYRGYWSDMSRTFAVGGEATDAQQALFDYIRWIQTQLPGLLRPGLDGREIYRAMDEMIRQHPPLRDAGLIHHGGHAIGLRSHEMPDVNPARGGTLEVGNVICLEPGGYFTAANYGVRLENMYLVTESGCEDLCPGDVELLRCG